LLTVLQHQTAWLTAVQQQLLNTLPTALQTQQAALLTALQQQLPTALTSREPFLLHRPGGRQEGLPWGGAVGCGSRGWLRRWRG
jgi:hypothetical protein